MSVPEVPQEVGDVTTDRDAAPEASGDVARAQGSLGVDSHELPPPGWVGGGNTERWLAASSGEQIGRVGSDLIPASVGTGATAANKRLVTENDAFRAAVDANVRLKSDINRLMSAKEGLELRQRTLQEQLLECQRMCRQQLQQIDELEGSMRDLAARGLGTALTSGSGWQQVEEPENGTYKRKAKDILMFINQLTEDDRIKTQLLQQKEEQLKMKQATLKDLQTKYGIIEATLYAPTQRVPVDNSNGSSKTCTVS